MDEDARKKRRKREREREKIKLDEAKGQEPPPKSPVEQNNKKRAL